MARATVAGKQLLLHGTRTGEKLENRGGSAFGTTKVGVEEKMELKRTRVLKLGLKEIA